MIVSGGGWKPYLLFGLCGILLGLSYLIMPAYVFVSGLTVCIIFIVALIRPRYGFYLLIFIFTEEMTHFFINLPPYYIIRIFPYELPLVATAVGLILTKIANREAFVKTPVTGLLWAIVIAEVISCIWAPSGQMAFWLSVILLSHLAVYFLIINIVVSDNILRTSIKVWIASGIVGAVGIIASQWIDFSNTIYLTSRSGIQVAFQELLSRPSGFAGSNHIGGLASTAFFLALGSMMYEKRWKVKIVYLLILTLLLFGVILTASRGVFIGLIGAFIFYISAHIRFKKKFLRYSIAMMVLTLVLVLLSKPAFIDRMLIGFGYTGNLVFSDVESYSGNEAETSTGQGLSGMEMRNLWWKNALDEMVRHPLKLFFGLGIGGFFYYSGGGNTVTSPEVNSVSFAFFYDIGIVGIILFIFLAYVIVKNLYYYLKNAQESYSYYMLLAATTAMIAETGIHGLVDYDLTSYGTKFFWFPLGLTMAALNILKCENPES
jgi:hypothetical protein